MRKGCLQCHHLMCKSTTPSHPHPPPSRAATPTFQVCKLLDNFLFFGSRLGNSIVLSYTRKAHDFGMSYIVWAPRRYSQEIPIVCKEQKTVWRQATRSARWSRLLVCEGGEEMVVSELSPVSPPPQGKIWRTWKYMEWTPRLDHNCTPLSLR